MKTLQQRIIESGISMTARPVDENPNMENSANMDHWKCTLRRIGASPLVLVFSMGKGLHGIEPGADDVLSCLLSDACTVDNAKGFEDWASELGYSPDSRKAERTFRVVEKQAKQLQAFLADDYAAFLYETEQL